MTAKTLRDMFISGNVTLCSAWYNLRHNGATKLRGKLQEKLPSITTRLSYIFVHVKGAVMVMKHYLIFVCLFLSLFLSLFVCLFVSFFLFTSK